MSPTAFLRFAALCEVRRALLDDPFARDPISRAASDFGFWHLSRFAGHYRALFGESPSDTVANARLRADFGQPRDDAASPSDMRRSRAREERELGNTSRRPVDRD
jgi:AraC-like DNA-binding protein